MKYKVADKLLNCPHCMGVEFLIDFGSTGHRMFHNQFECQQCGRLELFSREAKVDEIKPLPEPEPCLACGHIIQNEETKCSACGWSYKN